jgi:pimeloyl-ACP methyl ester carboxylesterase
VTGRTGYVTVEEGVRLFYQMRGEGSPTLIVPGACLLAADLEPLAENRTVLFYDDRGRGASDPPADPWDIWTQYEVDDLEAIRRAFGLERIQLFGWAYFAGAAALYAMAYPERIERMALVCPITPHYPAPYSDEVISLKRTEERIPLEALQQLEQMQRDGLDESDPVAYCRAYSAVFTRQAMARPEALERMRSQPCLYSNEWPKNFKAHWQSHFPESSWQRDRRVAAHAGGPYPGDARHARPAACGSRPGMGGEPAAGTPAAPGRCRAHAPPGSPRSILPRPASFLLGRGLSIENYKRLAALGRPTALNSGFPRTFVRGIVYALMILRPTAS